MDAVQMLGLKLPTDPRWVNIAEKSIDEILIDHAYCEQKAATSCISMIVLYHHHEDIVDGLSPIVSEEWAHFRAVLAEMRKRGIKMKTPRKDEYVNQLLAFVKKINSTNYNNRLLHQLLLNALIEARSCERFRLLSLYIDDENLKKFYYNFMVSEAGHYTLFMKLAENHYPKSVVRESWQQFLKVEAEILENLEYRADRMH